MNSGYFASYNGYYKKSTNIETSIIIMRLVPGIV